MEATEGEMEIFLPWLWVQLTFLRAWIYGHLVFYGTAHFTDALSLKQLEFYMLIINAPSVFTPSKG